MDLYHSLAGMVSGELTAADPSAALHTLSDVGIRFFSVTPKSDLTVLVTIRRCDRAAVYGICKKRGYHFRPVQRKGLYWNMAAWVKRPILIIGCLILLFLILFLPTRVLFVEVEGNDRIPSRKIVEAAENCGIVFGASRRDVRSERVKNALLQAMPELQWAGVNSNGCVAVISVREKSLSPELSSQPLRGNIVALRDGIILSGTATRGNLLCQPGQAVKKGQVLISGYTDCGIKIAVCTPEGEIYGQTVRTLEVIAPAKYRRIKGQEEEIACLSLLIGKKRINLWKDSGIWDSSCGRIYEENYITLPGGFRLPFGWAVDTCIDGESVEFSDTQAESLLDAFANKYLSQQMIGGSVLSQNVRVRFAEDAYRLAGEYVCAEMIGTWQAEKIGEVNGKSG